MRKIDESMWRGCKVGYEILVKWLMFNGKIIYDKKDVNRREKGKKNKIGVLLKKCTTASRKFGGDDMEYEWIWWKLVDYK